MTVTEFGYCPHCDQKVELVPQGGPHSPLACHKCGAIDVYDNRAAYEHAQEERRE